VRLLRALPLAFVLLAPSAAHAGLDFTGCIRDNESSLACTAAAPALGGARGLALAPGGGQLYVATQDDASLGTFSVDGTTGGLGFARCVQSPTNRNGTSGECGAAVVEGLQYDTAIVLSPDGRFAYTGGLRLNIFSRDITTGALTYIGCADRGGTGSPCATHDAAFQAGVNGLAISPDGDTVYATSDYFATFGAPAPSTHHSALLIFDRDAATGLLSDGGCAQDAGSPAGCAITGDGLLGPLGVAVSPGNDSVYVANRDTNAVTIFKRELTPPHALTPAGCIMQAGSATGCATTAHGLARPTYFAMAPDGRTLTVATDMGSTAVLTRAIDGELSFSGCLKLAGVPGGSPEDACANSPVGGTGGEFYVTPDGRSAYSGGRGINGLAVYARDPATGFLSFVECFRDTLVSNVIGCTRAAPALHGVGQMQASADGRQLYVAVQGQFSNEGGLLTFARTVDKVATPKPAAPKTVPLPSGAKLPLPLTCPTGVTEFCSGDVVVTTAGAVAARRLARVKIARRTVGGRVQLRVRLPRTQRRAGTRLHVRITRHNANGTTTRVTRVVRLVRRHQ
jgi:DNA-binding beta-propeller fold protein YncE